ncbi:MAG: helix-turn-helix domain-containing protein [Anaerolineae bacterium]
MAFEDISARMKQARAETATEPKTAADPAESFRVRARMVGVLLRDARMAAERSQEDCGRLLHVGAAQVDRWELGDETPSLPQLELLAYFLDVPVSHFWGLTTREQSAHDFARVQQEYLALRDRMVGVLLRQAREEAGLSLAALSSATGIPADLIEQYELGELPAPMHELTVLGNAMRKNLSYFLESSSQLGELLALREMWKHFASLPEDLRQFAANPINVGFLEIAYMLSQMPTDRLRRIGESVLNITM